MFLMGVVTEQRTDWTSLFFAALSLNFYLRTTKNFLKFFFILQSKIEMLKCIVSFVCFIKIWVFCIWPISLGNLEISLKWMILENLLKISTKWQISKNHLNLPKSTIIFLFGFSKQKKNNIFEFVFVLVETAKKTTI